MKNIVVLVMLSLLLFACKNNEEHPKKNNETNTEVTQQAHFASFGKKITPEKSVSKEEILKVYKTLKPGDTIETKFTTTVKEVCQAKGCWMRLDLDPHEAMVKFKDYGFFMPKDIAGKEVIVHGKAFVEAMSVADQKHYAADSGASAEDIAKITAPKITYSFEADGVLVNQE
jgi:hypothetical protein